MTTAIFPKRSPQDRELRSPELDEVSQVVLAQSTSISFQSSSPLVSLDGGTALCVTAAATPVSVEVMVVEQASAFDKALDETNKLYPGMLRRLA